MRVFIAFLLMMIAVAAFAKTSTQKEKAQTIHKMSELKLQGKLKKPELEFQSELITSQNDFTLASPQNFEEEAKENGKDFLTP